MPSTDNSLVLVSTGISGLDEILGGGIPQGHLYVLEGMTGTGKTTLAMQFALAGIRAGERVLYVTLAETERDLHKMAKAHGWNLDGVNILEMVLPQEQRDPQQDYNLFYPAEVELGERTQRIQEAVERINPQRLVLDSLTSLRLLAADPLRHRRQVETLRLFLEARGTTALLVDELLEIPHEIQPRSLVHGLFSLEETMLEYGRSRQRLRVTKIRNIPHPRTWHDYRIRTGGVEVYPHLVSAEHQQQPIGEPAASELADLDALLGGGLGRGSSTLLLGPAGTGKSTLALQYAVAAARRGEKSLICLFDEQRHSLVARGESLGLKVRDHLADGLILIRQIDPNDLSPGQFAHSIRQQVEQEQLKLVVFDGVSGYMNAMPEQRFLALHFHELLSYLARQGVVTLMVMGESSLVSTESASRIDLTTLADTVLLLRFAT
ncbi:MAG: ATPase domain-containing protein, partial [Candidatus Competibacteraceae bacterium]|nr:ATPase domain-containing protein [Candidatus Competibacteraceae bacterium]